MYRLTDWGKTRVPLPYVPWRDMSDEEFAQHGRPLLVERGYFEQVEAEAPAESPSSPALSAPDDDAASPAEVIGGRRRSKR